MTCQIITTGDQGQYRWMECDGFGVPEGGPASHMRSPVFINTAQGNSSTIYPSHPVGTNGPWHKIDVSDLVPEGTKMVEISCILIITQGSTQGIADLTVAFRKPGYQLTPTPSFDPNDHAYMMQSCDAWAGGGQRTNGCVWVTLDEDRCFEFRWGRTLPGTHPTYPAYGINGRIIAYRR